jgi:ubiquinone/menaquinone biosynthesis C-methylase UbiE
MRRQITGVQVRPYSRIAIVYNRLTGFTDFRHSRRAFETLVRHYGIAFRSAVDVGCGTGLFACYLSEHWRIPVFAVDRSSEMLAIAKRNCKSAGVCFLKQDFRCLRLPLPVELATANTYTLNHLLNGHEFVQALRRIHRNLKPAAHLVFDIITDSQALPMQRGLQQRMLFPGEEVVQQVRWHPANKLLSIVVVQRSAGSRLASTESHVGRGYSLLELGRCLRDSGFMIRGIHDAESLRPATKSSSKAFIVALRRGG